eukprot:782748-Prymnesium_polylepis.2
MYPYKLSMPHPSLACVCSQHCDGTGWMRWDGSMQQYKAPPKQEMEREQRWWRAYCSSTSRRPPATS